MITWNTPKSKKLEPNQISTKISGWIWIWLLMDATSTNVGKVYLYMSDSEFTPYDAILMAWRGYFIYLRFLQHKSIIIQLVSAFHELWTT